MIRNVHTPGPRDIAVEIDAETIILGGQSIVGHVIAKGERAELPEGVSIGDKVVVTHGRSTVEWVDNIGAGSQLVMPDLRGSHYGGGDGMVVLVRNNGPSTIVGAQLER